MVPPVAVSPLIKVITQYYLSQTNFYRGYHDNVTKGQICQMPAFLSAKIPPSSCSSNISMLASLCLLALQ